MIDPFTEQILSITGHHKSSGLSWDVLNHETNTVQNFPIKLDALLYQRTLPHATIYFKWYEDLFKRVPFYQEPIESLAELKKQRALEIRRTYDYVRLWFSGGADSTSALNAFLDNDIHLDEIIVYMWPDQNVSDPLQSSNRELLLSAIPYLQLKKDKLTKTKITNITLTKEEYSKVLTGPDKLGYIPFIHSMDSGSFLYGLNCSQSAWEKVLRETEHENFCDLFGGTKAMVCNNNGNYYLYMVDTGIPDMALSKRSEDFHISKTDPRLFLKTAHLLKNYIKTKYMSPAEVSSLHKDTTRNQEYNLALGRDLAYHSVAGRKVDRGDMVNFSSDVGEVIVNHKHFLLVTNLSKDEEWRRMFLKHQENLRLMKTDFDWIWNFNKQGIPDPRSGYKGHVSKLYSLDKFYIADNSEIYKNGFTG